MEKKENSVKEVKLTKDQILALKINLQDTIFQQETLVLTAKQLTKSIELEIPMKQANLRLIDTKENLNRLSLNIKALRKRILESEK